MWRVLQSVYPDESVPNEGRQETHTDRADSNGTGSHWGSSVSYSSVGIATAWTVDVSFPA
jgi:hypothetical protein